MNIQKKFAPHLELNIFTWKAKNPKNNLKDFNLFTDIVPGLKDMKEVLDLCVSLWGHLRPRPSEAVDDDVMEIHDDEPENAHKTTMVNVTRLFTIVEILKIFNP